MTSPVPAREVTTDTRDRFRRVYRHTTAYPNPLIETVLSHSHRGGLFYWGFVDNHTNGWIQRYGYTRIVREDRKH